MKVSINWLKDLVQINKPIEEVAAILTDKTVGVKELTDQTMELDMKGYNRADLLSLRGVAYEVAAVSGSRVKFQESGENHYFWMDKSLPKTRVDVEDGKLCPLYTITKIEGLKVGPSPKEWIERLASSGVRSVNNVADITNLIMLEYGQPMHSFDAKVVVDEHIIVRSAKPGEKIVTLDDKTRVLEPNDLLITDSNKTLGIAGVMGGKNSEITDKTSTILLESAIFNPENTRKTATRLGLQSEAGKRFYHGLTKKRLFQALDAAVRMYEELGGKVTALDIVGETEDQLKKVPLRAEKVNSLIGVELRPGQIESYLTALNFKVDPNDKGSWVVTPPYYRLDVEVEEDLIEEVTRMYGYEKIPSIKIAPLENQGVEQSLFDPVNKLKHVLAGLGLTEVQTYSFYSTKVLENLSWYEGDNLKHLIRVQNPISAETEYLRMTVWPNLVEIAARNIKNGIKDLAVFEIGKMYSYDQSGEIEEGYELAVIISDPKGNSLAQIYGIYKKIAAFLGLPQSLETSDVPPVLQHLFHPNKFLPVLKDAKQVGGMAEIHPRIVNKFGVEQRMAVLGLNLSKLTPKS